MCYCGDQQLLGSDPVSAMGYFLSLFFKETKWVLCIVSSLVKLFAYLSEAESFCNIVSQCFYVNYRGVGMLNWLIRKSNRMRLYNGQSLVEQQDGLMS